MAYEYRDLTPEERAEIVRQRQRRGYPLHAPPHPFRHAGTYLITAANYEHTPIMASASRRIDFEASLLVQMDQIGADTLGWTVLTNHYHVLICVESLDLVSNALKRLHGATSRVWNLEDGLTGKRRVWYKFHDRMIRDNAHLYCVLNYVHYNAAKHGHVDSPYDWPWTSLGSYLTTHGRNWLRTMWVRFPIANFGTHWDD
jgi:putative transposase